MKQTLLKISVPKDKTLYPAQFRKIMGLQTDMPDDLFHYAAGQPANGRPAIRFVGAKGWVGILGDEAHSELILSVMGAAVRAATTHCGRPVQAQLEEHDLGIKGQNTPKHYWIREMALKRRHPRAREMPAEELVKERLLASIEAIAARYGMDCPTADDLGIEVTITRTLGMAIGKGTGPKDEYISLVNAEFIMHADLSGFWFAGNLTARGYGRIGAFLPGAMR